MVVTDLVQIIKNKDKRHMNNSDKDILDYLLQQILWEEVLILIKSIM